jgi:hypothetical protein
MERLASHPEIKAYGELLLSPRTGWPDWPPGAGDRPFFDTYLADRHVSASSIRRHGHLYRFLDWVYEPAFGCRTIGFKLMYDEARPYPELFLYLRSRRVRVLHLRRENLLDIAVSQMGTTIRAHVHAWHPHQREDLRIPVDTSVLIPWLVRLERERKVAGLLLRLSGLAVHDITYESLMQSDAALDGALAFLGLPDAAAAGLHCGMLKLAPLSHRAGLANFDEVARLLAGTRFYRFLRP